MEVGGPGKGLKENPPGTRADRLEKRLKGAPPWCPEYITCLPANNTDNEPEHSHRSVCFIHLLSQKPYEKILVGPYFAGMEMRHRG